jgi:hypothetical protein
MFCISVSKAIRSSVFLGYDICANVYEILQKIHTNVTSLALILLMTPL